MSIVREAKENLTNASIHRKLIAHLQWVSKCIVLIILLMIQQQAVLPMHPELGQLNLQEAKNFLCVRIKMLYSYLFNLV
jgi:hypothetical protein